jgi:putative PIN family toxin of toxin-antitoxin system
MKAVIDTNLLIAAFFNKYSASSKILRKAERGNIKVLWTESIKREAKRILDNIHASQEFRDFLEKEIFRKENRIKNPPKIEIIKEDVEDNKFLSCAKKGKADIIISNDRHLLKIKDFKGIPILTSTQALKWKSS